MRKIRDDISGNFQIVSFERNLNIRMSIGRNSSKVSNIVHMQILQNIASEIKKKIYHAGN